MGYGQFSNFRFNCAGMSEVGREIVRAGEIPAEYVRGGNVQGGGVLISSSVWSTADYVTELSNQA